MNDLGRVRNLLEAGNRQGAIGELAKVIIAEPHNLPAWRLMAELIEEPEKKADCFRYILRLNPNDAEAKYRLKLLAQPPKFQKMQEVQLCRSPNRRGIIVSDPMDVAEGWQYQVFWGSEKRYVAEEDLEPAADMERDAVGKIRLGTPDDLLRHLALLKYRKGLAGNLYAFRASRTQFEPYQFKPALKFLNNPDQRLLIADEVGLGKTIEAGIIFLELQARLESLPRVLVVCPAGLRQKWYDELRSRFDEIFTILESVDHVRRFLDDYQRTNGLIPLKGIVSLELIRREEFAEALAEQRVHFDLVILDEAHHCKNPETLSNNVASVLCDNADAMLLLTATPLQLGYEDLYYLFQVLLPGEFDNLEAFRLRLEPNQFINRASKILDDRTSTVAQRAEAALRELQKVESTAERQRFLNNPYYAEIKKLLLRHDLSEADLIAAQRQLSDLNTLAPIFTRTRRREVQMQAPKRKAFKLSVHFTPEERQFYESVIKFVRDHFLRTGSGLAPSWAVMIRERQAASCISAVREHLVKELAGKYITSLEDETLLQGIVDEGLDTKLPASLRNSARNLVEAAQAVGDTDTKFDVFLNALRELLGEKPSTKLVLFSFFRNTLEYLYRRLRELGYGVLMIHGGHSVTERQAIMDEFRTQSEKKILLSSEVGAEGLDFQFCDTLVNYDLPWNPMKVEQRIGRIDRFGQQSPVIRIYNLVIEDSIEERIFMRLYERIGIFEQAIGDLEAILGEEIRELSKRIFTSRLTPREEEELAEQTAKNIVRRQQDMEAFEAQRLQFMGQGAILENEVDQVIKSGRYVSGAEVKALVETFLRAKFPRCRLESNGDDTYFLELDHFFIEHMKSFIYNKTRVGDPTAEEFYRRLAHKELHGMPITFSDQRAFERKLVEFVTLRHPIAQAAAEFWGSQSFPQVAMSKIIVKAEPQLAGDYYFFVYSFDAQGLERNTTLVAVTVSAETFEVNSDLSSQFLRLVQTSCSAHEDPTLGFDENGFRQAKSVATVFAANERSQRVEELRRSNEALVSARIAAKTQSFQIKKRTIEEYIRKATEPRILRMREAQLRNLEAKHAATIQELNRQRQIVVDYALELAGMARVISA